MYEGDTSYYVFLSALGCAILVLLAAASRYLHAERMVHLWVTVVLSWPLVRDLAVLMMKERTQAMTDATMTHVHATETFATIPVFGMIGALSFLLPRPFKWRLKFLGSFVVINLGSTSQMEYPHIGDTCSVVATTKNEIAPLLAGFFCVLLTCGNEACVGAGGMGAGPAWPGAWTRGSLEY